MNSFKIKSYAKINLALNVTGKKSKLHNIESLISFIHLHDLITLRESKTKEHKINFFGKFSKNISKINTISKLLKILDNKKLLDNKKFEIKVIKNIPQKAGMGGGSMNAASLLNFFIKKKIIKIKKSELKKISNEIVDTLVLARDKFPGSPVSLDALCKRYRVDNSKRTQHTALIDCDLLAKVYINLIDQKEPMLNFQSQNSSNKKNDEEKILYFKKVIKPSLDEEKKHQQYLRQHLKKNFFN